MSIESRNPATGELLEQFSPASNEMIEEALDLAVEGHEALRRMPLRDRAAGLRRLADLLDQKNEELARVATLEMGKTLKAAKAEVTKCASVCSYYAEHGAGFLRDEPVQIDEGSAYVAHLPLGPILAVMPWNFPYWQVFRFAAPALMAGNSGLLKHASNVPQCALAISDVIAEAGFPKGAFQTLLIGSDKVEGILRDARIRGATLTGSGPAGSAVGALAGETIKPSVLELGGSDAFIVMPSADLDAATDAALTGRTQNNGQSCIAAKRFIIHEAAYDAFREKFAAKLASLKVGDPMSEDTDIGPLANASGLDDVVKAVEDSVAKGARRTLGAKPTEIAGMPEGHWFEPGMLEDIPEEAPAFKEEIFGPVALLSRVPNLDEAIDLANCTEFGLGSVIFTKDRSEVDHAVRRLEAGATAVNRIVASDPRLPFGGVKTSGYGRELARDGMMAFVNRKTVTISGL
ncbi:NAD-dependent succinate-semialdehyde dehydrogenase [Parvularcula sp. ZS-1/3]|uniref:NAD-dependent succinate-semialdehyde dehydrogenase n=1 Tax=Parvularcula mediterranea TaxID=2732508 RepID=A0A7Y3RNI8_9PROT|nr:NAD-dependent succinate-semialdehyde dehydrogenase [Parvularcula mediterranea]NNU17313.1 NAD-dependent succinate-semialdehyde dehydrogenase [Parvularcula mediterranea]